MKIRDRVYCLKFDNQYELCMTFLRYEEFYESPNLKFQGHSFTIAEYMSWYTRTYGSGKNFYYPSDWGGFNIPVEIINKVRSAGISDPNHYDSFMWGIYGFINGCDPGSYLIGITDVCQLREHELTHAMYYIDDEYRAATTHIFDRTPIELITALSDALLNEGYAPITVMDEIQAYITTGESDMFQDIKHDYFDTLRSQLIELHKKHFAAFCSPISSNSVSA
jgi:hypothetical protein